jgi:hypothetical protein
VAAGGVKDGELDGILVATGSEVATALEAARTLHAAHGRRVRVVSMPCWEAFLAQPQAYRDEVLPPGLTKRLSVEAGTTFGWSRFAAHQHGLDHYGASAPGKLLAEKFGFTPVARGGSLARAAVKCGRSRPRTVSEPVGGASLWHAPRAKTRATARPFHSRIQAGESRRRTPNRKQVESYHGTRKGP